MLEVRLRAWLTISDMVPLPMPLTRMTSSMVAKGRAFSMAAARGPGNTLDTCELLGGALVEQVQHGGLLGGGEFVDEGAGAGLAGGELVFGGGVG